MLVQRPGRYQSDELYPRLPRRPGSSGACIGDAQSAFTTRYHPLLRLHRVQRSVLAGCRAPCHGNVVDASGSPSQPFASRAAVQTVVTRRFSHANIPLIAPLRDFGSRKPAPRLSLSSKVMACRKNRLLILTAAASVCTVSCPPTPRWSSRPPGVPGDYVLPDGSAKTLVQENCTICHNLRNIVNSNKSQDDWQNTVNMMTVRRRADRRRAGRADQGLPDRELPGKAAAQAGRDRRPGPGQIPDLAGADAGLAPA